MNTKELRELTKIDSVEMILLQNEIDNSMTEESREELLPGFSNLSRGIARRTELFKKSATILKDEKELQKYLETGPKDKKKLVFRFLLNPSEIKAEEGKRLSSTVFAKTLL